MKETPRELAQTHIIEAQQHVRAAATLMRGSRLHDFIQSQLNDLASIESLLIPDSSRGAARVGETS